MEPKEIENLKKAGEIAAETVKYSKNLIKKDMKLLDIANKIEAKIVELGGKPAFPVNLAINEITAHYTPSHDDDMVAGGLLKVDLGVHVNGYITDVAFSLDLEGSDENKKLISASGAALIGAIDAVKDGKNLGDIGGAIQNSIINIDNSFSPIKNLSGHEIAEYRLHAGLTIPNYDNGSGEELEDGIYAIEPFATTGQGVVYDGKDSGIYIFLERKGVRDPHARKMLDFIEKNYQTLPFCSRWLVAEFGTRALLSLSLLKQADILHQYSTLIEKAKKPVSQAEATIIISNGKVEVI